MITSVTVLPLYASLLATVGSGLPWVTSYSAFLLTKGGKQQNKGHTDMAYSNTLPTKVASEMEILIATAKVFPTFGLLASDDVKPGWRNAGRKADKAQEVWGYCEAGQSASWGKTRGREIPDLCPSMGGAGHSMWCALHWPFSSLLLTHYRPAIKSSPKTRDLMTIA